MNVFSHMSCKYSVTRILPLRLLKNDPFIGQLSYDIPIAHLGIIIQQGVDMKEYQEITSTFMLQPFPMVEVTSHTISITQR